MSTWRNLLTVAVALTLPLVVGALTATLRAQAPTAQSPAVPEWQTAAGGKMAFDGRFGEAEQVKRSAGF